MDNEPGHLFFDRRIGEAFVIELPAGLITVRVAERRRDGAIRLEIAAPRSVPVDRAEVHARKQQQPRPGADGAAPTQSVSPGLAD